MYYPGFVDLLTSQNGESSSQARVVNLSFSPSIDLDSPELPTFSTQSSDATEVKDSRKKWTPKEDLILISAWLNTSKDPIVGNAQKSGTFWKRIQEYYNASVSRGGFDMRELGQCKQRWARINDLVSKFCGCYDAALRDQSSGQNDNDVMKRALDYYFNDYSSKFTLEHAWRELRHDQKWCSVKQVKEGGKEKRKTAVDCDESQGEVSGGRPPGVKAAKAAVKKKKGEQEEKLTKLRSVLELKEKLNNQKLLEKLLAKDEPLTELEMSLKQKLMSEMI